MVSNLKIYIYGAILIAWATSLFYSYDSGFDNGANAEKLVSSELRKAQQSDYNNRLRLVAEYSNGLQEALTDSEIRLFEQIDNETIIETTIEKEVFIYVTEEIESGGAVWLSDCWIRLHDKAATISAEMPRSDSDPTRACMGDAAAATIENDRPEGYYSSGEALKIITDNYAIARQWRRQLIALQHRELEIQRIKFDNWK